MGFACKRGAVFVDRPPPWIERAAAQHLVFSQSQNPAGAGVARADVPILILQDDSLRHRRHDAPVPLFALTQRRFKLATFNNLCSQSPIGSLVAPLLRFDVRAFHNPLALLFFTSHLSTPSRTPPAKRTRI
jgi:hypothetical protein